MKKLLIIGAMALIFASCKKEAIEPTPIKLEKPDGIMIPIEWYINRDKSDTVTYNGRRR